MREFKISDKTIEQLEYDKVLQLINAHCLGQAGIDKLKSEGFTVDVELLQRELNIVKDYVDLIESGGDVGLYEYEYIKEELYLLSKEGYVLEAESVLKILSVLRNYDYFISSFSKDKIRACANLYAEVVIDDYDNTPIKEISKVFDEEGNVKPNASPELTKIFKRTESVTRQLDDEFNSILAKYKNQNILSENVESWRNGRRVLVLPVENKRKIGGVLHDQSSSGKTVFIEPEEVMQINNELFSLDNEKRAEIYRILKDLSAQLSAYRRPISNIFDKLSKIDSVRAKAKFSIAIEGQMPKLNPKPILRLQEVKHPLLLVQLNEKKQKTVAFDLDIKGQNRLLLISGPNAGGKSVTLKAVGLIHLLTYAGILVSVDEASEIGMFDSITTDIGDQQSIDEGLSTYSSHLTNLNEIVTNSNRNSLVLLDEIGSGTDPKLGGAIAEGIIKALLAKRVFGIITTHYSALKVFAFHNQGIVNGAMLFDKEHLQPTYRLKVGKPGSSYAFEVAKKIGLDDRILNYARKKVGKKENLVEDLLIDLQEGKAIIDEQLEYIKNEKEQLAKLIESYNQLNEDFQLKRKKLQIKAKEISVKENNNENIELQRVIRELEKEKDLDKARELKKQAVQKRQRKSEEIMSLKNEVREVNSDPQELKVGNYVRMVDSELSGEILSLKGQKAEVIFGLMRMEVNANDLILTRDHLQFNNSKINFKGVAFENNFSPKLDIRGYKIRDAEDTLQEFFDKALLSNVRTLEIVHGKGSGALRKLVIKKMKEYNDLDSYWHPADEFGGDGVTMIKM